MTQQATLAAGVLLAVAAAVHGMVQPVLQPDVYLPLHSLVELASIAVGFSIFALYVNAHAEARDSRSLFIGSGFLAVAVLDTLHLLSFAGMPAFVTASSTEKSIYFWLAARMWASLVLLLALYVSPQSRSPLLKLRVVLSSNLGLSTLVFVAVSFFAEQLPRMYVAGEGLTSQKTAVEVVIVALSLFGAWMYAQAARSSGEGGFYTEVAAALVMTALSELCMSIYTVAYDGANLLGHLFKVGAYFFIFRGLFVSAVRRPYLALERSKDEADARLERAIQDLAETTRAERFARERAEAAIEMLRPLQTVEEAVLSNRNLDELLHDLLERARGALGADCATVFLLEDDGSALRIRASVGLDQGTRDLMCIPMGAGIAGTIAQRGEAMVVPDVSEFEVVNRGMRERVSSVMGVPLKTSGRVIGVIHVGAANARKFTDPDLHLLKLVGEGVASAVSRARLYGELEATISSMASAVVVYDRAGSIVRMNLAAERIFGYSEDERLLPVAERLACLRMETPEGRPILVEESPPMRALRGEIYESELMVIRRQGRTLWLSTSAAPVRLHGGEVLGAVVTLENVTPMREMEEQRSQHVLGLSHGLRTPLTVIQGRAQILERMVDEAGLDRVYRDHVQIIVSQARRMGLAVKDLVDLTHLESGRPLSLNLEPVEMGKLTERLVRHMGRGEAAGRLGVAASSDLPLVRCDADRIERAIANLIVNALKYSGPEEPVTVAVRVLGDELVVSVEDRGPGLPVESLPYLFDRGDRSRFIPPRGDTLGLGLYITNGLARAHGGRVWAESQPGKGSTFSVALPVA